MKRLLATTAIAAVAGLATSAQAAPAPKDVLTTYADIAHATYEDSLISARALKEKIDALVADPSAETMAAARAAWIESRVPYQQSEAYRFGNPVVDAWEGKVNAWPLDEGLIDYVAKDSYGEDSGENVLYTANVVANETLTVSGETINASEITKDLLADVLHEAEEVEANVATGYHAIEFLLWGQDLNGTGPGAGERPWSDYAKGSDCTNGNCDRRAEYLVTATELMIDDLEDIVAEWAPGGDARVELVEGDAKEGLGRMMTGLGSLSYGELAGERMKLGLMLHDPEEEHDCFSDNTHNSHHYNAVGIKNVYLGAYERIDGSMVEGASLSQLVADTNPALDAEVRSKLEQTEAAMGILIATAEAGEAYDQMIGAGNADGNRKVQDAIDALTDQTRSFETVIGALGLSAISFEGSDSLDDPGAVFQ